MNRQKIKLPLDFSRLWEISLSLSIFQLGIISFFLGLISVSAWAPIGCWPLGVLTYSALYYIINKTRNWQQAAFVGFCFGLGLHALGHATSFYTMLSNFKITSLMAALSLIMFILYLSVTIAIGSAAYKFLIKISGRSKNLMLYAAILTLCDYSRSLMFNGFTTLSYGYIFTDTYIDYLYAFFGVYGVPEFDTKPPPSQIFEAGIQ